MKQTKWSLKALPTLLATFAALSTTKVSAWLSDVLTAVLRELDSLKRVNHKLSTQVSALEMANHILNFENARYAETIGRLSETLKSMDAYTARRESERSKEIDVITKVWFGSVPEAIKRQTREGYVINGVKVLRYWTFEQYGHMLPLRPAKLLVESWRENPPTFVS